LNDDEYCEVTPQSIRLRKKILNTGERTKSDKRRKMNAAKA
jgi:GTP-binding protein